MRQMYKTMLERKHGMFDKGMYDYCFDSTADNASELCEELRKEICPVYGG